MASSTSIEGNREMVGEQGGAQKWRLQIKEDDKFFSRLLSKESSTANPSLRVYYGGVSGAVPFTWESQPGTPKHPSTHSALPPLTPPPSYYSNSRQNMPGGAKKKQPRSNGLLHSIFTRLNKNSKPPEVLSVSSPSMSSSSSMSGGSLTAPNFLWRRRRQCCSSRSSFDSRGEEYEEEEEEEEEGISPTSTLCFRMGGTGSGSGELRRRCSVVIMKKAFLSMVGHRSGQGTP